MRTAGYVAGGILWCVVVFVTTLYATFPSQALVDRIKVEAPNVLGPDTSVDLASVSPWWVGIAARDLKIYKTERATGQDGAVPTLMGLAKDVRVRASLWSLVQRTPHASGSVTLAEGRIDYAVGTSADDKGRVNVSEVEIQSKALPLADLLMLVPGFTGTTTGAVDIDVVVEAGEKGMSDASGRIDLSGGGIVLSDLEIPGVGPLGMDVPISALKISGDIRDGEWTIDQGRMQSDLLQLRVEGSLSFRDPIERSTVDIELIVSDLGQELQAFESFMSSAKGSDGAYHYQCRGMLRSMRSCTPKRDRTARARASRRSSSAPDRRPGSLGEPRSRTPVTPSEVDEERERRREEIRERLRQRREEREARIEDGPEYDENDNGEEPPFDDLDDVEPPFPDEDEPYDEEEDEFIDE